MKNMVKKILSIILTVIMILSAMPVTFAAEASVKDTFIEEYAKWGAYIEYNSYAQENYLSYLGGGIGSDLDDILKAGKENNEEKMLSYIEMFKERRSQIEKNIADGKLTVVIDGFYVALID